MALFARSKVERFHEEPQASGPGPGDYDPCVPKSSEYNTGAVSLGFTAPKGAGRSPSKDGSVTDGQESVGSPLRESRSYSPQRRSTRRMTVDGTRHVSSGTSRIILSDAGQSSRKFPWSDREEEKLETEAAKLREREKSLAKSQFQARTDAAKALSARDALLKRAGAAERKMKAKFVEQKRLDSAEAEIARLERERAAAEEAARSARQALEDSAASAASASRRADTLAQRVGALEEELESTRSSASLAAPATDVKTTAVDDNLNGSTGGANEMSAASSPGSRPALPGTEGGNSSSSSIETLSSAEAQNAPGDSREQEAVGSRALRQELATSRQETLAQRAKAQTMEGEVQRLRSQLLAAATNTERLEAALGESNRNAAGLQERLADALAEGVEYADAAIRSEESLRNSEADCAALWEEREEAKQQLAAAFVEGHALEEKLEQSIAERAHLELALRNTEARLETATREGEEVEDELASSREEGSRVKQELEVTVERLASLASETRVLRASLEESGQRSRELERELSVIKSALAVSTTEAEGLRKELEKTQEDLESVTAELKDAATQIDTGAADYVLLERKLGESDSEREKLRRSLEAAESKLEAAAADDTRGAEELLTTLAKCTHLQEMLGDADDRIQDLRDQCRSSDERVQDSETRRGQLAKALAEAQAERKAAVVSAERLEMQLSESTSACAELEEAVGNLQKALDEAVAESRALQDRLKESKASSAQATDTLRNATSKLAAEVAAGVLAQKELKDSEAECEVMLEEIAQVNSRLAEAGQECLETAEKLTRSEAARRTLEIKADEAGAENARLHDKVSALETELRSCQSSLAEVTAEHGACSARTGQLEAHLQKSDALCADLRNMLQSATEAMNTASSTVKTLEQRLHDTEAQAEQLRLALKDRGQAVDAVGDSTTSGTVTLDDLSDDPGASTCGESDIAGMDTEQRRKLLAGVQGVGKELGEKLSAVLKERNAAVCKLEVAQGALAASSAASRKLERSLANSVASEKALQEELASCKRELESLREEFKRLEEAGETRAEGAAAMLAKSEAEREELSARLHLQEVESSRELALAQKERERARSELEAKSRELKELRILSDSLSRAKLDGSRALREAGIATRQVERLTHENATLAGHNNSKQKIRHLEDLKRQNIRLLNDTANLSSELALATAVLEVVGVLPKEVPHVSRRQQPKDDVGIKIGGSRRGLAREERGSSSVSPRRSGRSDGDSKGTENGAEKKRTFRPWGRCNSTEAVDEDPRVRSQRPRLALEDRLLNALGSAHSSADAPTPSPTTTSRQASWRSPKVRVRSAASKAGCFVLKCGGLDRSSSDVSCASSCTLHSGSGPCLQLADQRIREEVRKVLAAQASSRLTSNSPRLHQNQ